MLLITAYLFDKQYDKLLSGDETFELAMIACYLGYKTLSIAIFLNR